MEVVIISRKRAWLIMERSGKVLPSAKISISEEEVDKYAEAGVARSRMLIHPNDILGPAKKRNWVLRNVQDETCVIVDDDLYSINSLVGETTRRIQNERSIMDIFRNSEEACRAIGTGLFCYNVTTDPRKIGPHRFQPIDLVGGVGGIIGVIGRRIWFDENLIQHEDIDFALQALMLYRVVYQDCRFVYDQRATTTKMFGGNQGIGSRSIALECQKYMKRKWGAHVSLIKDNMYGRIVRTRINVQRQQPDLVICQ